MDYRAVFEGAVVGVFQATSDGRLLDCNPELLRILGAASVEALQQHVPWLRWVEDNRGREAHERLLTGQIRGLEGAAYRCDQSVVWVSLNAWRSADGVCGTVEDIAARREQLDQQQFLSSIVENIPDMIFIKDADELRFVLFNRAGEELLGYQRGDLIGKNDYDFFPTQEADFFTAKDRAVLESGSLLDIAEEPIHTRHGTRYLHTKKIPLLDASGRPRYLLGISQDITDRKHTDEELKAAKDGAEAASRAKSQFLANMSHEIRTPINAIIGMTDLTLDVELPLEARQYLLTVKAAAVSLLSLIDDILDLSRIEAGKLELEQGDFSLRGLVAETLEPLAMQAFSKRLELVCDIRASVPDALIGDGKRLRQLLVNLVGNAIKFTHQGEVVVRIELVDCGANEVCLHLSVSDTGIGIAPQHQQIIFEPFTQADPSFSRRYGGSGLGLSISSRLAALMGGEIHVASLGRGTTFDTLLRLRPQANVPPPKQPRWPLGMRVLAVEDNATAASVLEEMLSECGVEFSVVDTAAAALQAVRERHFKVALLGLQVGAEDVARLLAADTTVVVMVPPSELRRFAALRKEVAVTCLFKPIGPTQLLSALQKAITGDRPAEAAAASHDVASTLASTRVLVVEDNIVNQVLVRTLLQKRGADVSLAANGVEALQALDGSEYDVILLDMQMPLMDGYETARAIREREARDPGTHVPIVAVTACAMPGDEQKCLDAGVDRYIAKPVSGDQLCEAIQAVMTHA